MLQKKSYKMLNVKEDTWREINYLRIERRLSSVDKTIVYLLSVYDKHKKLIYKLKEKGIELDN
jgi:hypothetical protein